MSKRWLLVLVLSIGCGAAQGGVALSPASTDAPPTARPWTLVDDVGSGQTLVSFTQDGDGWVVASGRLRLRVAADLSCTIAAQGTASPIHSLTHAGDRWLVTTHAGEVFRASTPLGSLEPVGSLGGVALGAVPSRFHRLAILDARGELWLADARAVTRAPCDVPIGDAAFLDADFGVRLELPARVSRTADGGRTWSDVALPIAATPWTAFESEAGIVVQASSPTTTFVIGRDGPARVVEEVPALGIPHAPADVIEAARRAISATENGRLASPITPAGRALFWASCGQLQRLPDGALTQPPDGCARDATAAGERFVIRCNGHTYTSDGASAWTRIADAEAWLDPTSERFVTLGPCHPVPRDEGDESDEDAEIDESVVDEYYAELVQQREEAREADHDPSSGHSDEELRGQAREQARSESENDAEDADAEDEAANRVLCVHEGDATRDVTVGRYLGVVRFAGGLLWVRYADDDEGALRMATIDLAAGDHVEPLSDFDGMDADEVIVGPDGTIAVRDPEDYDGAWYVGVGEDRTHVTLPEGAHDLLIGDRDHLVASGGDVDFLSEDGGRTFGAARDWVSPRCDEGSCRLGSSVWTPHADLWPVPAHIDGASTVPPPSRNPISHPTTTTHVVCRRVAWWSGHPLTPPLPALADGAIRAAGGWIALAAGTAPWTSGAVAGRLGGVAPDGTPFEASLRAGSIAAPPSGDVDVEMLAVSASLAVGRRCVEVNGRLACDLFGFPTDAAPFTTGEVGALTSTWAETPSIRGALVLDGGAIAVLVTSSGSEVTTRAVSTDVIVTMSPDGTFSSRTFELGWVRGDRALARDAAGQAGLLLVRDGTARWLGVDGGVSAAQPAPPAHIVTACGAPAAGAIDFVTPLGGYGSTLALEGAVPTGGSPLSIDGMVVASLAPDGSACVREAFARDIAVDFRGSLTARAEDGVLVGRIAAPGVTNPARTACRVRPNHPDEESSSSSASAWSAWGALATDLAPDGALEVVFGAGVASYTEPLQIATLRGDAWTLAATPVLGEDLEVVLTIPRSAGRLLVRRRASAAIVDGTRLVPVTESTVAVVGAGESELRITHEGDGTDARLVATRGATVVARSPSLGAHTVVSVALASAAEGDAVLRGLVSLCDVDADHPRRESRWSDCTARAFTLDARAFHLLATVAAGTEALALARSSRSTVALVAAGTGHDDAPTSLEVVSLDGRTPRRLYPAITASSAQNPVVFGLGLSLTPTPRVVYQDTPSYAGRPDHVRVVELRGGEWVDVVEPYGTRALVRVVDTDAGFVMIVPGEPPQVLRVEGTDWRELPVTLPARPTRR